MSLVLDPPDDVALMREEIFGPILPVKAYDELDDAIGHVNAAAVHGALPSLPFGGIGQSGSGRHHGLEGFREFSNLRGVFVRGEGDLIEAFVPPYGATAQAVVDGALAQAGA